MKKTRPQPQWGNNTDTAAYMGISLPTLWRYQNDPKLDFPKPTYIYNKPHNNFQRIDRWMAKRSKQKSEGPRSHPEPRPLDFAER
jgi:predicted DNA-binding transcriptional regulator AlpA